MKEGDELADLIEVPGISRDSISVDSLHIISCDIFISIFLPLKLVKYDHYEIFQISGIFTSNWEAAANGYLLSNSTRNWGIASV